MKNTADGTVGAQPLAERVTNKFNLPYERPRKVGLYGEHNSIVRDGALVKVSQANPELLYKEFDFGVPFGPEGWYYYHLRLTLQRFAPQNMRPSAEFILEAAVESYGRWTGDDTPWTYSVVLLDGSTPLREVLIGWAHTWCDNSANQWRLQSRIPNPPNFDEFPLEYYNSITGVRLYAGGNQESC